MERDPQLTRALLTWRTSGRESFMQSSEYEKGLLVQASWRLSRSNDINELVAVACVIRNWVVPKLYQGVLRQPLVSALYHGTFTEAIKELYSAYPLRPLPNVDEPVLIDPSEGLLLAVDGVYDCSTPDATSSKAFPGGARYFARAGTPEWMKEIIGRGEHPLIGNFGSSQFYA